MKFTDEYEIEVSGYTYYVNVEGYKRIIEGKELVDLEFIEITDEMGEQIDEDNEVYLDIYEDAIGRDYDFEVHNANFDYYDEVS